MKTAQKLSKRQAILGTKYCGGIIQKKMTPNTIKNEHELSKKHDERVANQKDVRNRRK